MSDKVLSVPLFFLLPYLLVVFTAEPTSAAVLFPWTSKNSISNNYPTEDGNQHRNLHSKYAAINSYHGNVGMNNGFNAPLMKAEAPDMYSSNHYDGEAQQIVTNVTVGPMNKHGNRISIRPIRSYLFPIAIVPGSLRSGLHIRNGRVQYVEAAVRIQAININFNISGFEIEAHLREHRNERRYSAGFTVSVHGQDLAPASPHMPIPLQVRSKLLSIYADGALRFANVLLPALIQKRRDADPLNDEHLDADQNNDRDENDGIPPYVNTVVIQRAFMIAALNIGGLENMEDWDTTRLVYLEGLAENPPFDQMAASI